MNWNMFFVCLLIAIIPCSTFFIIVTDIIKKNKKDEKVMEEKKPENVDILVMMELDNLEIYVKSMTIPELNKKKILHVIDFEKDVIKYSIISDLGKAEYEKLRK